MAPTYEYQCEKCQKIEEIIESIEHRPETISCSECTGVCRRVLSAGAFKIKGYSAANRYSYSNKNDRK